MIIDIKQLYSLLGLILALFAVAGIISAIAYKLTKERYERDFVLKNDYEKDKETIDYKFYDREKLHNTFVEMKAFKEHVLNFDRKMDDLREFIGVHIDGIKELITSKQK